ncbi:hypothetical protein FZC76_09885 [Sutcliffiella horikoshii]|uniref:Uncharacterized protein n=1 Tax=Sutcliffiella horikoshii TaxID=79883 RepID=A0A5D4T0D0_9BACI|nr:hypothetical protein [Sutcliffiella horikoshii]TYS68058.1 hypothetical protein FZC76_09885 [Sutcliffiella horikoshii]
MKLVLYNNENKVLDVYKNISKVEAGTDEVTWNDGAVKGIKANFIVLPDEVEIGETIDQSIIDLDEKTKLQKKNLIQENEELKGRVKSLEETVLTLMDWV